MSGTSTSKPVSQTAARRDAGRWAVKISRRDAAALGRLRSVAGLRVCDAGEFVWLSAEETTDDLELQLRALPGGLCFQILTDGQLVPLGRRVPQDRLPMGSWKPLREWLTVELGVAQLTGAAPEPALLRIIRGGAPVEANCLLCAARDWQDFAARAPALRLARWTFAADARGRVIVRGTPAPPVAGELFVERAGVAIPAGWRWDVELDPEVIAAIHGVSSGDLAIVHPAGDWELLPADAFVGATRSAVRALVVGGA
jgi:hypothetical protein